MTEWIYRTEKWLYIPTTRFLFCLCTGVQKVQTLYNASRCVILFDNESFDNAERSSLRFLLHHTRHIAYTLNIVDF